MNEEQANRASSSSYTARQNLNRRYNLIGSLTDPTVRMHVKWESVRYWVKQGGWRKKKKIRKDILCGVSGEVHPGQVSHQ